MTVKVTNKDFGYTVKYLKKAGYTFDASSKTWTGTKDISFLVDEGYATVERAKMLSEADLYNDMMNNPNSIY